MARRPRYEIHVLNRTKSLRICFMVVLCRSSGGALEFPTVIIYLIIIFISHNLQLSIQCHNWYTRNLLFVV